MTRDELGAQVALRESAISALRAINALAATLSTADADAVALASAVDARHGIELRTVIRRGTQSSFELSIVGALGRRRVLASCTAVRDLPTQQETP